MDRRRVAIGPRAPLLLLLLLSLPPLLLTVGCAPRERDPAAAAAAVFTGGAVEWIDMTHTFDESTIFWPTARGFELEVVADGMTEGGYYYAANNFCMAEHGGTHLDAPIHFAEGRSTADEIPVTRLIGRAVVIDVSDSAAANPDYRVRVADLQAFEAGHGPIPEGAIVLLRTGWARYWPDRAAYLGTDRTGAEAVPELHFPGLHPDAARWLVENRDVGAVGIDTPSIDYGQSERFRSHRILYGAEVPGLENVANLDRLAPTGAYVLALPMKIAGGSGAPLRMVGAIPRAGPAGG